MLQSFVTGKASRVDVRSDGISLERIQADMFCAQPRNEWVLCTEKGMMWLCDEDNNGRSSNIHAVAFVLEVGAFG